MNKIYQKAVEMKKLSAQNEKQKIVRTFVPSYLLLL